MNPRIVALVVLSAQIFLTFSEAKRVERAASVPLVRDPQQAALLTSHSDSSPDGFKPEFTVENSDFKDQNQEEKSIYSQNKHKSGSKSARKALSKSSGHSKSTRKSGKQNKNSGSHRKNSLRGKRGMRQQPVVVDLRNRWVPYDGVAHDTDYSHTVPENAQVNIFRVNCRRYNNCTAHKRSDDFEEEIRARTGLGPLPNVPRVDPPITDHVSTLSEDDLRQAVHDPTDELINHLTMFGKDRRVTLWVQQLFRQNRLPTNQNLMDRIDQNFFVGNHRNIGNPHISSLQAVQQMNFDQYFRHLQITIGRTMYNQRLVHQYGVEKNSQRMMWGHRRLRQRVYESILQMENIIYMEQRTLAKNVRERRRRFDEQQAARLEATMKALEGKPFYYSVYNRNDIFRD